MPKTNIERFDWRGSDDRRDLVHQTVQHLAEGRLVLFPTETDYVLGASAGHAAATERVGEIAEASDQGLPAFAAVDNRAKYSGYFRAQGPVSRRLVERCWPGPVAFVFAGENSKLDAQTPVEGLPSAVRPDGGLAMWIPDHPAVLDTLRLLPHPLVLYPVPSSCLALSGEELAITGLATEADVWIDDGPSRFEKPATVVRVNESEIEMMREGVVSAGRVRRLASQVITFVCTGNTCRSPMAEAIFKRMIADRLECGVHELPDQGFTVTSAGLAAIGGASAAANSIIAVRQYRGQLEDHVSQGLTPELAQFSDRLIVMTDDHRDMICRLWPQAASKTSLLCSDSDVCDPFGGPLSRYEVCAEQIVQCLEKLLEEVMADQSKTESD